MRVTPTALPGVLIIEPRIFKDDRGCFTETYQAERYSAIGVGATFVQDNLSRSVRGVLRGLHYQLGKPQGKLVMAAQGEIFDVAVDIRRGSPTFGRWVGVTLSAEGMEQLYIPEGFAHGFCVLSESAVVCYKCTDYYSPSEERGIRWDDPALKIDWPIRTPLLSPKDAAYSFIDELPEGELPLFFS